jgi:hypothetical protein
MTYSVRVVQMQHSAPARRYIFMTLPLCAHRQCRIHVDIMAGQIQADEALEDYTPSWPG